MILSPGILALLLGGVISLLMLTGGALLGVRISLHWNPGGAEAEQLHLERLGWLVASLVRWALVFEILSLLLFLYTIESIHPLFVGAMCATGTLNANPIGWHLIWIKLALFLLGSFWLVMNHLDGQLINAPLTRIKFILLIPLLPLVAADVILMWLYFSGLEPEIITSCCGALFGSGGQGVASSLASLPIRPMIVAFYTGAFLYGLLLLLCRWRRGWGWRTLLAFGAVVFGAISVASVISFISIYYYRLPTHHCPFDLLQGHYGFVGYPLYIGLFGTVLCGVVPQMLALLHYWQPPVDVVAQLERRWIDAGLILLGIFLAFVSWPLLFGHFSLSAYL